MRDLCARLPYGVKGRVSRNDHNNRKCEFVATIDGKLYDRFAVFQESWYDNVTIKPYLFPLSSMSEEQKNELIEMEWSFDNSTICNIIECFGTYRAYVDHSCCSELIDWFHKNHFDYRGLIPMGLANDTTGLNIY